MAIGRTKKNSRPAGEAVDSPEDPSSGEGKTKQSAHKARMRGARGEENRSHDQLRHAGKIDFRTTINSNRLGGGVLILVAVVVLAENRGGGENHENTWEGEAITRSQEGNIHSSDRGHTKKGWMDKCDIARRPGWQLTGDSSTATTSH